MRPLKLNYLLWPLVAILYSPIFYQLYRNRWEYIDYTHAYFILPVSLWLAWSKRKKLKELAAQYVNSGTSTKDLAILSIGILMFIFGWRKDYLFISSLSLIPVLWGLIKYLYGPRVARELAFPILYLLLMVPPPLGILDAITLPMRYGVSYVAYLILRSCFLPVTREGLLLSIEGQELFMGAACSGFRSLITMLSLGLVYIYLNRDTARIKWILAAFLVPLALVGNLVRVLVLCLVAYYFGQAAAQGFFHDFSGFFMFIIMLLGLLALESFLKIFVRERTDE